MATTGLPARRCALDLLAAVLDRRAPLDEAVAAHRPLAALAPQDRAFARLLVATVLRRLGEIDASLAQRMARPLPARRGGVRHLLRLGAAQILFLGTPAHAAVSTTVSLARATGLEPFAGLVNAVLRRMVKENAAREAAERPPATAGRMNTPAWLWRSWTATYGEATAEAIAAAHLSEPPLDLTVAGDPSHWAERLDARVLPMGSLRRPAGGAVTSLPGYAEGAWWVQDAAAALPARLVSAGGSARVLDLCAAPGGKTAQLGLAGMRVTAVDRSAHRAARLRENLARLHLEAEIVVADARVWQAAEPFPFVLLDAPCTATGTIRRHPDIAHLKRPADVSRMAALQAELLDAAHGLLAPGGVLVYAVCSLQPEECEAPIRAFLARHADMAADPITPGELPGTEAALTQAGALRTLPCHWPDRGGLDGFFAIRLKRRN